MKYIFFYIDLVSQVPNASQNSAQFIIENHESSSLFSHFNSDDVPENIEKKEERVLEQHNSTVIEVPSIQ